MSVVPVLDIAPFRGGSPTEKAAVAARLDEICRDVGFLCLTGHGVPDDLFDDIYNVSKTFFRRDLSEKVRVAQPSPDIVRGYIGVGAAALADTMGEDTPPTGRKASARDRSMSIRAIPISRPPPRVAISRPTSGPTPPRRLAMSGRCTIGK
jgi:isopenicillin N synthase-like dioxygenase